MTKPPSRARSNYSLRFNLAERSLLETAASHRGEYLSEFIRRTALSAATRELAHERRDSAERVGEILPRVLADLGYDLDSLLAISRDEAA